MSCFLSHVVPLILPVSFFIWLGADFACVILLRWSANFACGIHLMKCCFYLCYSTTFRHGHRFEKLTPLPFMIPLCWGSRFNPRPCHLESRPPSETFTLAWAFWKQCQTTEHISCQISWAANKSCGWLLRPEEDIQQTLTSSTFNVPALNSSSSSSALS